MVDEFALHKARELANSVRFSEDQHDKTYGLQPPSLGDVVDTFYRSGVEIKPHLTPKLEDILSRVCENLSLDREVVHAFVNSSHEIQAACYYTDSVKCIIRISSALINVLEEEELGFVIGHELGHFLLQHAPTATSQNAAEYFVFQRAKEFSADRIGLIGCGGLETASNALVKTASGLNSSFIDVNLDQYLEQLNQLKNPSRGENPFNTHPSMLIRAFALKIFANKKAEVNYAQYSSSDVLAYDKRLGRFLLEFVDKELADRVESAKQNLHMWIAAKTIVEDGRFTKTEQETFKNIFGQLLLDKLKSFLSAIETNQLSVEIQKKIHHSESQLKGLVPTEASKIVHALTVSAKSAFK